MTTTPALPLDAARCYAALGERRPEQASAFYVGVRTTGVFCRPTCPARPPKRENCEFFRETEQALRAGYRPCRRCRPLEGPNGTSATVRRAIAAVEREPTRRWREADVAALGAHPSTLRRLFRKELGMTFAAYARAQRLGAAFKAIRGGERVIMAQLDAGYESGSGFRRAFANLLGAPPRRCAGPTLFAAWLDTPLGAMVAVGDEAALHLLEYADRRGLPGQLERLRRRTEARIVPGDAGPLRRLRAELAAYFAGRSMRFATPLARDGTKFQNAVWDALAAIPPGETRSYGELARAAGRARAIRAVGQANGANPFAILVPCHRAVAADGGLGGYGGGVARKQWLIDHERQWAERNGTERQGAERQPAERQSAERQEAQQRRSRP
jgi:AraC family transcriptional regulator of adaptative response/methylated-DNA-[protein]-cysteine methyltransferase